MALERVPPASKAPLILHEFLTPYFLLFVAFMIPRHRRLVSAVFVPLLGASYYHLLHTTSPSMPVAFVVGTYIAFHAMYSIDLLLLRDPRKEFRRTNTNATNASNGSAKPENKDNPKNEQPGDPYPYHSFTHRISWTLSLILNMRGVGWNWCIHPIPRLTSTSLRSFLRHRILRLLFIWVFLDFATFYMQYLDAAYFLPDGNSYSSPALPRPRVYTSLFAASSMPQDFPPPRGLPPVSGRLYSWGLHAARTLLQGTVIYTAMDGVYTCLAVIAASLGAIIGTGSPGSFRQRYLDWRSWPDLFGGWRDGDWGHGLAGWWGTAWHGLFKYSFTSPARFVAHTLGMSSASLVAKGMKLVGPFVMSALLHYTGSYTLSSDGWGCARFFLVQPVGIVVEQVGLWLYRWGLRREGGKVRGVERYAPYVWAVVWFVVTAEPFLEDLRYGGVWGFQPVPVSVWKGVWGVREGWWPWRKDTERGWREWWVWDESAGGWGVRF